MCVEPCRSDSRLPFGEAAGIRGSRPASRVTCLVTPPGEIATCTSRPIARFVPAGSASTRYLSVTLSAPASATSGTTRSERSGVDVSLVLDRSGSMAGSKIELARQAVAHAIRLLRPDDQLNVVVYDHEVDTVLERMPAAPAAKKQALAALGRIDARGSTNLAEGWFTGARSLGGANPDDRVRRVLLLTDGLANQGLTDAASLREAAARLRAEGISTSTFGVGNDFDEELLTSIAADGGGHFYFIEQPAQIPDFFASELGEVLDVVARDVVFEVAAGPGVRVDRVESDSGGARGGHHASAARRLRRGTGGHAVAGRRD